MSRLIPQLRADKTGKMVTRHVLAEPKSAASSTSIPKPVLSASHQKPVAVPNAMDRPVSIGPFSWKSSDPIIGALHRKFGIDESKTVELTSTQWLQARRTGVHDRQIHAFLLAGITEPDEMLEFAQQYDRSLSPNIKPGVHRRREMWVDRLLEAGVTKEEFDTANRNFGSYGILTLLDNFDFKGDPADAVRMYAEYSNKQTREALNEFVYSGTMTLDQLKEFGVSRVRKHKHVLLDHLRNDGTINIGSLTQIVKAEEKSSAAIISNASNRIAYRLRAVDRWGMERASELREPGLLDMYSHEMDAMGDEGSFAFAKHHDEVIHLSILRGSVGSSAKKAKKADFSKSKEYSHLSASEFYAPSGKDTLEYFRVGLTPQETIEALENGIDPIAARGVKEGVTPAVASGWL